MITAILNQKQGKNSDSVGEVSDFTSVPENNKNRVEMPRVIMRKRKMSKTKMIVPRVESPMKRCGVEEMTRAMPPVDMVDVYHAQVM